ncbi:Maleylpyruvate isomerase [compost metagenome]
MRLFSFFNSSTSYRVRIALMLKGVPFDYVPLNLRAGEQRGASYRTLNPAGGVPLWEEDDGTLITQSLAIIDRLDSLYPFPRLIPPDGLKRTRALEVASLIACDIHPLNNLRVLGYLDKDLEVSAERKSAWYRYWIYEGLAGVEGLLARHGTGPYCLGDTVSIADCCLIPQIANALRMGCELEAFPLCMQVYRYCSELLPFQLAAPQMQPDYLP